VADTWERVFGRRDTLYDGMEFPVFGGKGMDPPFRVEKLLAIEVPAHHLRSHRFLKDAKVLVDISLRLNCRRVVSGLLVYRKGGREILFVKGADRRFKEVALASIFAKYFREVHMMAVNQIAGFSGEVPVASGYPADPDTGELVGRLLNMGLGRLVR